MGKGTEGEEYGIGHQQSNLNLIRIQWRTRTNFSIFVKIIEKLINKFLIDLRHSSSTADHNF